MKTIPIIVLGLCAICSAEKADEITRRTVPGFVGFDSGLDHSPEGRRKTALNNAEFHLEHYMASDKVLEGARIAFALGKLKEQMRIRVFFKERDRTNKDEIAFEVDQNGAVVIDQEKTRVMRAQLLKEIAILEQRLAEIYNPHKVEEVAPPNR